MFGMGGTEILVILVVALLFLGPDKLPEAAKKISQGIRDIKKQTRVLQRTIEDDEHIGGAIRDLKSALRGDEEPIRPAKARAIEAAVAVVALPEPPAETPSLLPGSVHDAVTAPVAAAPVAAYAAAADDAVAAHHAVNGAPSTYAAAITSTEPAEVVAATVPAAVATPAAAPAIPPPVAATPAAPVAATVVAAAPVEPPALRMPPTAGEPDDDDDVPRSTAEDDAALAALVRPAPNTIARSTPGVAKPAASSAQPATSSEPTEPSEPKHG